MKILFINLVPNFLNLNLDSRIGFLAMACLLEEDLCRILLLL